MAERESVVAGVYVHIPYCRAKCRYCAFSSRPLGSPRRLDDYLDALGAEIRLRRDRLARLDLETIYLGGGTPSLAPPAALGTVLAALRRSAGRVVDRPETTLEANPEGLDEARLSRLREAGFRRLSVGVQSFDEGALRFLGRRHGPDDGPRIVEAARRAGFADVGLDLILGLPAPFEGVYESDLPRAIACDVSHVSAYLLTVEEPSALARDVAGGAAPPSEAEQVAAYRAAHARLTAAGFAHYEVSNFARPGFRSRHNAAYWSGAPYLGFGAGAHSFAPDGQGRTFRRWNEPDPGRYVRLLARGRSPTASREEITPEMARRERLMLAVRTDEGVTPREFGAAAEPLSDKLVGMAARGWLRRDGDRYRPTPEGFLRADAIALTLWEALE